MLVERQPPSALTVNPAHTAQLLYYQQPQVVVSVPQAASAVAAAPAADLRNYPLHTAAVQPSVAPATTTVPARFVPVPVSINDVPGYVDAIVTQRLSAVVSQIPMHVQSHVINYTDRVSSRLHAVEATLSAMQGNNTQPAGEASASNSQWQRGIHAEHTEPLLAPPQEVKNVMLSGVTQEHGARNAEINQINSNLSNPACLLYTSPSPRDA